MSFDVQRLVDLGRVGAFDRSPDGTWLAVEVGRADDEAGKYRSELWRVPKQGAPERIAVGRFHDGAPRFRSDGALLFLSDRTEPDHTTEDEADKDTHKQVWCWADGALERLTDEPLGVSAFEVADTGRMLLQADRLPGVAAEDQRAVAEDRKKRGPSLLHYRSMPVRFWDHWIADARPHFVVRETDGSTRDLTPDSDREYIPYVDWDLSRDGATFAVTRARRGRLRIPMEAIEVVDVDSGERRILGVDPDHSFGSVAFSPDGSQVATARLRIDEKGLGRQHIHVFDLASGEGRNLATHWDRWPSAVGWLDDHRIAAVADDRGSSPLFSVDTRDGAVQTLTTDRGSYGSVRIYDDRIWAIHHALLDPPEVVSVPATGGANTRHTALTGIDRSELERVAAVETSEVPATDGTTVPMFVMKPRQADGPHPLLLWIHGGPRSQWGETWHWRWNALILVQRGYVVGMPNPRGSTGLGQAWLDGIGGNSWGGRCYSDVMTCADALVARDDVDSSRTCAMGGSFGGYMTNWIGTRTDRFQCLITHASLVSFHQFGFTTDSPAWWRIDLGDPWDDRDAYERYSPDAHLDGWTTPTLILHGDKDYRVPVTEGLHLFEALERRGVDVELGIFPDENHWILKPRNIVAWYGLVIDYLERKLA